MTSFETSKKETMSVWGLSIPQESLSPEEKLYLGSLPTEIPPIEWLWAQMDVAWNELGLSQRNPIKKKLDEFYRHPVWLANGIYSEMDKISSEHRQAIAKYVSETTDANAHILDVGGGLGTLARRIATEIPQSKISIAEPFPRALAEVLLKEYPNVNFVNTPGGKYDLILAQDVLEHVEDPIDLVISLAKLLKPGGRLIFANCFYPVILCHLPQTFYLRYLFKLILQGSGFRFSGTISNCEHAQVFTLPILNSMTLKRLNALNSIAKIIGPILNAAAIMLKKALRH